MQKINESFISLKDGITYPIIALNRNFKSFVLLSSLVSFIMSLVVFLLGRSSFCGLGIATGTYCTENLLLSFVSILTVMFGLAFFYSRWLVIISEHKSFKEVIGRKCIRRDFKAFGVLLLYILCWAVLGFCVFALKIRRPVESWKLELLFFFCVSVVVLLALILLLNFVVFQHCINGGTFFDIRKTFVVIFDNIYRIIVWFLFYLFVYAIFFNVCFYFFVGDQFLFVWLRAFLNEFFVFFNMCFLTSVIASSLFNQEKVLFSKKE